MPVDRSKYPADWPAISKRIRARAEQACECTGECGSAHEGGRCSAPNGEWIVRDARDPAAWIEHDPELAGRSDGAVRVVLTVAHLDHDTTHNADDNLAAMCQRCHLLLDRHQHARNAAKTRRARRAAGELPGVR